MRFRDRKHQQHVQNAERTDPAAQAIIAELSELLNMPLQQQQGFFAAGYYQSVLHERETESANKPTSGEQIEGSKPAPGMF